MFAPPLVLALMAAVGVTSVAVLRANYVPKVGAPLVVEYGVAAPVVTQPG